MEAMKTQSTTGGVPLKLNQRTSQRCWRAKNIIPSPLEWQGSERYQEWRSRRGVVTRRRAVIKVVDTHPDLWRQSSALSIKYDSHDGIENFPKANGWCMKESRPAIVRLVASGELPYKLPWSRKKLRRNRHRKDMRCLFHFAFSDNTFASPISIAPGDVVNIHDKSCNVRQRRHFGS